MADLRTLLDSIRENPDDRTRWLALSWWLWANEREDEAVAVRVLWSVLRDQVTKGGKSLEDTLADLEQNAKVLGHVARKMEANTRSSPDSAN